MSATLADAVQAPRSAATAQTGTAETSIAQTGTAKANTVLDDLVDAVQTYPHTYLSVEIFGVGTVGGGDQINEGDEVAFHVRVHNSGPLDVLDLVLTIEAQAGATGVKPHDGKTFSTDPIDTDPIDKVPAHQADGDWTELSTDYHFLAGPASKGAVVDLVKVSVGTWDASDTHIFVSHSRPDDQANDMYSHKVLGQ